MDEKCNIMTYLVELRVDIILPLTDPLTPPLTDGGLMDVGERCGVFLLTGDLDVWGRSWLGLLRCWGSLTNYEEKQQGKHYKTWSPGGGPLSQ